MSMQITSIDAREISDSRNKPTLAVTVACGAASGTFSVPSGASTGSTEACELRDTDGHVSQAVHNVQEIIAPALLGMDATDQRAIDAKLLELDGTPQKTNLGGNAMIGVSIATAKAAAAAKGIQVFEHLRTLAEIKASRRVPYLYMNYINGGKHAKSPLAFQEHIIVPDTESIGEALEMAELVGARLESIIRETYGPEAAASMGDEGGYVIPEDKYDEPFKLLARAIEETGFTGRIKLATDVAASSFFKDDTYQLGGKSIDAETLANHYRELAATYPILSIEDPFEEHDAASFTRLQSSLDLRVVGDDLTTTSTARITTAANAGAMRAVIIKPNQIGTLSETLDAMQAARKRDIDCIVSHRSGETMDDFIADLAYAFGVFGIKGGSPRRPERRIKYERLAAITAL